ncbi:putative quinol monooxygenase [Chitinophaga rhizophila]|uniref:Antibiotic biosynthesis monooxygenase n=1 Tax=Chitinophaga rhizophila TaxID=2866212 RepID=A0ABS7GJK8_9BACT|nr:putative quinol monooxygenase [Chitinophaga rhizophila]MBW8687892.1 antibiotic biosynthesis monooxygenase [Chitinophaga rhizophila]
MKIYLTAVIKAKRAYTASIASMLQNMVVHTKKESACLQYDLHRSTENDNVFFFYEIWENQEGLDMHNLQPYIREFVKVAEDQLEEPPLIIKGTLL